MDNLVASKPETASLQTPADEVAAGLMTASASLAKLSVAAGVPVVVAMWALLSPDRLLSREMSWDLLFNLSGAWHLHYGHVAHVDFHDPVGELNFLLTTLGFSIAGPTPHAFLVGVTIITSFLFTTAVIVTWRRLALVPAVIFVVFVCLLALRPANIGDLPTAYSFAMSYNRYGWGAISILSLLLFVPSRTGRGGDWIEAIAAGLLLTALYYLKVTYFVVGLGAVAFALLVSPHIRDQWRTWVTVGGATALNAIAPYNHAYLADVLGAVQSGGVRDSLENHLMNFFAYADSYAAYIVAFVVAAWMWWSGRAPLQLPLATAFLLAAGAFLLTQNAQPHGMPLAIVIAFLFVDQLRQQRAAPLLLGALLIFPLLSIGTSALSLVGYHLKTGCEQCLLVVDDTNLRGLAVPAEREGLLAAFAAGHTKEPLLNRTRAIQPRYELSQYEYIETITEAAALLAGPRYRPGGVAILDQVNPLPFMLGWRPPRGETLWSGAGMPMQSPEALFADVDHVLIPKFSSYSPGTAAARAKYGAYLANHFPMRRETQSWIVVSRAPAILPP